MKEITEIISSELIQAEMHYKLFQNGEYINTECYYWILPPPGDDDKTLVQQYNELGLKLVYLYKKDPKSDEFMAVKLKMSIIMEGVKSTKVHGIEMVTPSDLLIKDKRKGIRKEWWNLKDKAIEYNSRLFLGHGSTEGLGTNAADKLILMPYLDKYKFLDINKTMGNNYPIDTMTIKKRIMKIEQEIGIDIISATAESVEILFKTSITTANRTKIRYQLRKLCPDIEDLTSSIELGIINIWWD
jgi:hypothetical protein